MTHQDLRPLFEDPSAPSELRNFVALARSDGPSEADLRRLASRIGPAVGVSAGVLVASSAGATALGTPPAQLVAAQPGLSAKLGAVGKLVASGSGKLLAAGLSAGIGVGVWAYGRVQEPAHPSRAMRPAPAAAPAAEPAAEPPRVVAPAGQPGAESEVEPERRERLAEPSHPREAPVPVVTPLPPHAPQVRTAPARSAPSRSAARRAAAPDRSSAPVREEPASAEEAAPPPPPAVEVPSELSLIQRAEAARGRGAESLQLLAAHERLYPHGALAQEREVLAIELLLKLGKPQQARARAARFERSHPSSAHLPRVRALLERADGE